MPLRREWQPTPVSLHGEFQGQRLQSMGLQSQTRLSRLTFAQQHILYGGYEFGQTQGDGEDRRAWLTAVYGVSKSWTWLSDWTTYIYIGWDKVPLGKKWILMAFCQEKITLLRIQRVSPALACISWQVPHCFIIRVANIIGIKRRIFFFLNYFLVWRAS